MPGHFRFQRPE
jgi:hypothetical protein